MSNKNDKSSLKLEEYLILSEFDSLRDEIRDRLSRIFLLHQGLLLGTLTYATTIIMPKLPSSFDKEHTYSSTILILYYLFIFILPFIAFVVELLCTSEQDAIFRAGIYIKDHIEKVHRQSTFRGWEDWLERRDKVERRRTSDKLIEQARRFVIIPLYCISSSIVCTIGFSILLELNLIFSIILILIILSTYFGVYLFIIKKLNKAQEEELSTTVYNLLVLDVDGCLLDNNKKISDFNKDAISFIRNKGVQVVLASGRGALSIKHICHELNLKGSHVTSHGACIYNASNEQEKQLTNTGLSNEDVKRIIRKINELSIKWVAFGINRYYCMNNHSSDIERLLIGRNDIQPDETNIIQTINDFVSFDWQENISKILCYVNIEETEKRNELESSLSQYFQVMMSTDQTLEIVQKSVKKEIAIQEIIKTIDPNIEIRSLVVGDYDNDIGLLTWGRQAVAPSNASIKVKSLKGVNVLKISNNESIIREIASAYFSG